MFDVQQLTRGNILKLLLAFAFALTLQIQPSAAFAGTSSAGKAEIGTVGNCNTHCLERRDRGIQDPPPPIQ